nr:hypothetical protein [uncultured Caproiciproducens sp.]
MEPYQKMYYHLFNSVTNAIRDLQNSQKETESLFLEENSEQKTPSLRIYPKHKD